MMMLTSTRQTEIEVLIVVALSKGKAHNLLYSGVCSGSRVCACVCKVVSTVSCTETCRIDISSINE
jgi:hypothetical protein